MTAVDVDALDKLREAAKPLIRYSPTRTAVVAALLPVVDRIATERAAAELRSAAEKADSWGRPSANALRARAADLDPS